ncbi:MAG TPA: ABC transporter substrate-binding protein [Puia sp.]|nr:ABC transporter substrate-binding protein [Puia sp.]
MKTNFRYFLCCVVLGVSTFAGQAQADSTGRSRDTSGRHPSVIAGQGMTDSGSRHQVAIFVPLYLDSAFDASNNYRYDKSFPKFINPGLEFYEGAQLALDSLQKEQAPLDIQIYDTRSTTQSLAQVLQSPAFQKTELIIGYVMPGELQQMAAAAAQHNIPFINVNFPNDGGVTNNPSFVILNSTLRTHCEGIYKFIQRNYPTKPIVLFRKKGAQEDHLQHYFMDIEKSTASVPLKIKYITLEENFSAATLAPYLDSNTQTICVAGSLDETWARNFCQALASLNKTYTSSIIGMPTWDNIDFTAPQYSGEEIIYSTPFYSNPADNLVKEIQQVFKVKFYSRPSDMVFRGYETTYRFSRLLLQAGKGLNSSIGEKKYKVFNDFDIQPVLNRQTMTLDYFENKKLYFVKKTDGNITGVY